MENWIEFGSGPLFRLSFMVMILGLARSFLLSVYGMGEALSRARDRRLPWRSLIVQTLTWLIPVVRLGRARPLYSSLAILWHLGLIIVPLFLAAHVLLWERSTGFSWFSLPPNLATILTILTIVLGPVLFASRILSRQARALSRIQDYVWPLLLTVPFLTGYICSNVAVAAATYQGLRLTHVFAADIIMLFIPCTKIAHCILMPLSQLVSSIGWRFPVQAGDRVAATLKQKGAEG